MSHDVQHHESGSKGAFFIAGASGEHLATMTYSRANASLIIIDHTDVASSLAGQGVGRALLDALVAWARSSKTKVMPLCPFATAQFGKDASIRDVLM
jgi:predicted GNAT family acetyltransferase